MPDATLTQPSNAAPPAPPAGKPKKPASKKQMRRIAIASVTAAALAVGGYFLYRFLTKNDSAGRDADCGGRLRLYPEQGLRQRQRQSKGERRDHPVRRRHRA